MTCVWQWHIYSLMVWTCQCFIISVSKQPPLTKSLSVKSFMINVFNQFIIFYVTVLVILFNCKTTSPVGVIYYSKRLYKPCDAKYLFSHLYRYRLQTQIILSLNADIFIIQIFHIILYALYASWIRNLVFWQREREREKVVPCRSLSQPRITTCDPLQRHKNIQRLCDIAGVTYWFSDYNFISEL